MGLLFLILISLLLAAADHVASAEELTAPVPRPFYPPYDYFQLVMQYHQNVCAGLNSSGTPYKCTVKALPVFTIHGLWPSNHTNTIQCKGYAFNEAVVVERDAKRKTSLENFWPNILQGTSIAFWEHEWSHHGTCVQEYFSQSAYFDIALDIGIKMYNIFRSPQMKGSGQLVQKNALNNTVFQLTKAYPAFRCIRSAKQQPGPIQYKLLAEVVICVQHLAPGFVRPKLENCTQSAANTCGVEFIF